MRRHLRLPRLLLRRLGGSLLLRSPSRHRRFLCLRSCSLCGLNLRRLRLLRCRLSSLPLCELLSLRGCRL